MKKRKTKKLKAKLLDIRIYGDGILRKKSEKIKELTPEVEQFIENLKLTMYKKDGAGLAANQVGKAWRIFVVDPHWFSNKKKNPTVIINPEIVNSEGLTSYEEGCLSIPGIYEKVKRAEKITIKGKDEKWNDLKLDLEGLDAIVMQHEYDHLDGILFVDHLNAFTKIKLASKLKNMEKNTDENGINLDSYLEDDTSEEN